MAHTMAHMVQPPAPRAASGPGRRVLVCDLVGLGLFLVGAGWSFAAAALDGRGTPVPVALVWLACLGAVVAGLFLSGLGRWLPPLVVAAGGVVFALRHVDSLGDTLFGPLGYSNASGELFVLCALAGLMAAVAAPGGWGWIVRVPAGLASAGFAVLVVMSGSSAALVVLVLVLLAAPAVAFGRTRAVRVVIACYGAVVVLALVATAVLGLTRAATPVDRYLSANRPGLWHEAIRMIGDEPLAGVGPGRFFAESAIHDTDLAWAHNGFLQQGAEQGVPGLLLVVAVFAWGFVRLGVRPGADRAAACAAAALCALGVHASVDYVLHFPALPLVAAFLVGAGAAPPWPWAGRDGAGDAAGGAAGDSAGSATASWAPAATQAGAPSPAGQVPAPAEYQPQQWQPQQWQPAHGQRGQPQQPPPAPPWPGHD